MKYLQNPLSAALALAMTGLIGMPVAHAALDEVVVTAEKRETKLQDTPIAVSAFDANALKELSVAQVSDVVAFTPNLSQTSGPTGGNDAYFFIRGVGQVDSNPATDPGVGMYSDGVYLGRMSGANLDSVDLKRIEVLRGPQGTLFGRNTIGGAINVVTQDPNFDGVSGKARVSAGSRSLIGVDAAVNLPISETIAARIVANVKQQDGFQDIVGSDKQLSAIDNQSAKVKLLWEASDSFTALLAVDDFQGRGTSASTLLLGFNPYGRSPLYKTTQNPVNLTVPAADLAAAVATKISPDTDSHVSIDPTNNTDSSGAALTLNWDLDSFAVKSITSKRELEQYVTNDFDGSANPYYDNYFATTQDQVSQEFQFSGSTDSLVWLAGLFYYNEKVDYDNAINNGSRVNASNVNNSSNPTDRRNGYDIVASHQVYDLDITSQAIFGQATYSFTEALKGTLGFRYNQEEKEQTYKMFIDNRDGVVAFNPFQTPPGLPPAIVYTLDARNICGPSNPNTATCINFVPTDTEEWTTFDPKLGLDYKLSNGDLAYVTYAQGFRSGGFNGRPFPNEFGQWTKPKSYEPEKVGTLEFGYKTQLADNTIRLNTAVFFSKYEDMQVLVTQGGFFETANAGESSLYGFEAELTVEATEALNIMAGLGYTKTKYDELDNSSLVSTANDIVADQGISYDAAYALAEQYGLDEDDTFANTPEWSVNIGGQYTWMLATGASYKFRADYVWQDDVYFQAANAPFDLQEAYGLVNLRGGWESAEGTLEVAVYGKNVTGEEYLTNAQDVIGQLGVAIAQVSAPSEYGVEATFSF
ncbi:MAG: TonB-dependent receptor [Gammaproteobacteria bacterium]|nr:TonB-dependent receptor [Gammaproteobacteria bacterium]